ncbi:MAG: baseplate J/gp47 family protein [Oscillospiraceae bacterium]|nr:baseplate J/gp47 family protein [Oscillospiraceae bacterium]
MFEDYTYEALLQDVLDNAPDNIDTRQGSIFYDAVSGILLKVAKLYTDLDLIMELCAIDTATGDALTAKASEYGITRKSATPAKYYVTFEGTTPDVGERFYYDGAYFILCVDDDGVYYLEAEEAGESGNTIYEGTAAIPVNTVEGLTSATFGELYEAGADEEDDDTLRARVQEKIAGPAENGNKQHYKTWCESIDGVGLARIYPLWNGPNTVKAVLIDSTGHGCTEAKVAEVQEYIDPATKGYTTVVDGVTYVVGDGLGEGVANLGAHFTAVGAIDLEIAVAFTAELASGSSADAAAEEAQEAIAAYLKELSLGSDDADDVVVRLTAIGSIIAGLDSVLDYSDLTLNGGTANITPGENYVPVIGEVTVS